MPAIDPARLRQQAVLVAQHYDNPPALKRSLRHMLEFYAERSSRFGQDALPPRSPTFRVRKPVLREVLLALRQETGLSTENALALCDAFHEEAELEFGLLAVWLLGSLPASAADEVAARVQAWVTPLTEPRLLDTLLTEGLSGMLKAEPDRCLSLAAEWLERESPFYRKAGLKVLLSLARQPEYDGLPALFRLIQPLCRKAHASVRAELLDVLAALARRTPQETAYFLRQNLIGAEGREAALILRKTLTHFPPPIRSGLLDALREVDKT